MINSKKVILKFTKTVGERNEVDEVLSLALVLQRVFGQQIFDPDWSWRSFYHYQVVALLLYIYFFLGTLEVFRISTDVELTAEASYFFVLVLMSLLKLILFFQKRSEIRQLYITAKTTLFDIVKKQSLAKSKTVLRDIKKLAYSLCAAVLPPFGFYQLVTLWHYIIGSRTFLNPATSTLMPMTTPYYEIGWFLHTVTLAHLAVTLIIIDVWFLFFMFFLCVASDSLVNILKIDGKGSDESQESYAERLNEALKKFYSSHVEQVEYLNTLNKVSRWLGLVPPLNIALCYCILLLVMSKEFNKIALNIFPTSADIVAYCWLGERVKSKGSDIKQALLEFDWINMDEKGKKSYFNVISCMSQEYVIKTATGIDLSMILLSSVLKGSYQVFAVLRSMEN